MTTIHGLHSLLPILNNFVLFSICARFPFLVLAVPDHYLIDCGSTANTTGADGRKWQSDANSRFAISGNGEQILASTNASLGLAGASDAGVPYATARIFTSPSNYTFSVTPGRYWVRLYLFPFSYQNFDPDLAIFSVTAQEITLLSSINLVTGLKNSRLPYLYKEYSLHTNLNTVTIQFTPAGGNGSFAVINGLEVVSMQADAVVVGDGSTDAVETAYRLNVGGEEISPVNDSGLTRSWKRDDKYVLDAAVTSSTVQYSASYITYSPNISAYVAPRTMYSSARVMANAQMAVQNFNISWVLPIDVNFTHSIRLHFCELSYNQKNLRVFNIYIQNRTVMAALDLIGLGLKQNESFCFNFVVPPIPAVNLLYIQVGPTQNSGTQLNNAILNGIEVFKVNDSTGSLAGSGRIDHSVVNVTGKGSLSPGNTSSRKLKWIVIGASVVASAGLGATLGVCCCCCCCCCQKNRKMKVCSPPSPSWWNLCILAKVDHTKSKSNFTIEPVQPVSDSLRLTSISYPSSPAIHQRHRFFTLQEIKAATNNFDEALVIGEGGFGKVYRGQIGGAIPVAIKRANNRTEQGAREFENEISMLSNLRHRHLVSLFGFCDENGEMILVYEYMANGPLRNHLYGSNNSSLFWRQRLEICIGAARGLHYLHTGITQGIIHRDVKSTNILLDERFVAKVADFGISKTGPPLDKTHVSTRVKGSFGYLDPEYFRTQQLTEKSDVYSFGVVLLEVICARPVITPCPSKEALNIVEWALRWHRRGMTEKMVDSRIQTEAYSSESLRKVVQVARRCLDEAGNNRPTMGDVLWHLEYALQLQNGGGGGLPKAPGGLAASRWNDVTEHDDDDAVATTMTSLGETRGERRTATSGGRE